MSTFNLKAATGSSSTLLIDAYGLHIDGELSPYSVTDIAVHVMKELGQKGMSLCSFLNEEKGHRICHVYTNSGDNSIGFGLYLGESRTSSAVYWYDRRTIIAMAQWMLEEYDLV